MESPKPLTVAEFLAWEARQETDHELIDGTIVAMSNPTRRHARIVRRLRDAIAPALHDDCDLYVGDMTVKIEATVRHNATRPDIVVTCDERDRRPEDDDDIAIRFPKLIVEVLSPTTAATDLGPKAHSYFMIPTLQEYLIVDSRKRFIVLHKRVGDHVIESWPISRIELDSIATVIGVDELYGGIFPKVP